MAGADHRFVRLDLRCLRGQLFNLTRNDLLPELPPAGASPAASAGVGRARPRVGRADAGYFLIGGTIGGWLFSSLADRMGRKPVMALTILFYSLFSGLTAFAGEIWQVAALRFSWRWGSAASGPSGPRSWLRFSPRRHGNGRVEFFTRPASPGLWLAAAVGLWVGSNWRLAFVIGLVPALLVLWVRRGIEEPSAWREARANRAGRLGSFRELLGDPRWRGRAIGGALLAMAGLATFWGVVVAGQNLAEDLLRRLGAPEGEIASRAKIAYGFVQTTGAGLGMLAFGPLSVRFGRRRTFAWMHVAAIVTTLAVCWLPRAVGSYGLLLVLMPLFGFCAQGIHAGYAVYFPNYSPRICGPPAPASVSTRGGFSPHRS
jgi:MFS family permease